MQLAAKPHLSRKNLEAHPRNPGHSGPSLGYALDLPSIPEPKYRPPQNSCATTSVPHSAVAVKHIPPLSRQAHPAALAVKDILCGLPFVENPEPRRAPF